jgi:hypothetical protein
MVLDKCTQIMAYADDVVITERRLQDVEEVFASLIEQTNKMRLERNKKNTKFIILTYLLTYLLTYSMEQSLS